MKYRLIVILHTLETIAIATACWISDVRLVPRSIMLMLALVGLAIAVWANRLISELLFREYIWREGGSTPHKITETPALAGTAQ